jgi:hypothetical protein
MKDDKEVSNSDKWDIGTRKETGARIRILGFSKLNFEMVNTERFLVNLYIDKYVYDKYVELGFDADEWSKRNFGNKVVVV